MSDPIGPVKAAERGMQIATKLTAAIPNVSTCVIDHSATERPRGDFETMFRVGKFRVEMAYSAKATRIMARWLPHFPGRQLHRAEARQYREGRDAFFAEVAAGKPSMMVET